MGTPLYDITIYYYGKVINETPADFGFSDAANFVCDFYHQMLLGYKPPKTGRICIHIDKEKAWDRPRYYGSICEVAAVIDEQKYLLSNRQEQLNYLLLIVHQTCLELCNTFEWDKSKFEKACKQIIEANFVFLLSYTPKKSKDKRISATVIVEKTCEASYLNVEFKYNEETESVNLISKRNWFWYDSIYNLAKSANWIDNSSFGISSKKTNEIKYYSVVDKVIIGDISYEENNNLE